MDESAIDLMAEVEDVHWWHVSKRALIHRIIAGAPASLRCLDVGCGGGALISELSRTRQATGVDLSLRSLDHARRRGVTQLAQATGDLLPFKTDAFGIVLALDVIEHHSEPSSLLAELARILQPSGLLVATVPAYQWMWSYADDILGHHRRYTKVDLVGELTRSGFRVRSATYFHAWLLPLAWAFRKARTLLGRTQTMDDFLPSAPLNKLFLFMARLERHLVLTRGVPFGLSVLAVASHEDDPGAQ